MTKTEVTKEKRNIGAGHEESTKRQKEDSRGNSVAQRKSGKKGDKQSVMMMMEVGLLVLLFCFLSMLCSLHTCFPSDIADHLPSAER